MLSKNPLISSFNKRQFTLNYTSTDNCKYKTLEHTQLCEHKQKICTQF